nr:hypothetical protein [Tamlana carrageenivorans]
MNCKSVFTGGKEIQVDSLWDEYTRGKQTYLQLSQKYGCSKRTIQRKLDLHQVKDVEITPKKVIVLMDTTYWGRSFGLMLFKDAYSKENLLWYYVKSETNALYIKGINELKSKGFEIVAIVCDGRKGLVGTFKGIPVQLCQFHQVAAIRRYITKNPKMLASIELKTHVAMLKNTDKESFEGGLNMWFIKWESFLNERTINNETGKSHFTHKRLRSAYRSLNTNMTWLFTWYDNYDLNIPNTTNMIDGHFSDLKNKLRNHNGLTKQRKIKFINEFLKAKIDVQE